MKGLRLIIFSYCLLAALAGTAATGLFAARLGNQAAQLREIAQSVETTEKLHESAKDELLALREKQRMERDNYTAQQAIEASTNTQVAIDKEEQLLTMLDDLKAQYQVERAALQQQQTKLVPLLALTLLHWLLVPLTFRRKSQA